MSNDKIIHYVFALKPSDKNSSFCFVMLANSVESVKAAYVANITELRKLLSPIELSEYNSFIESCSIYCLGSLDYITGNLDSHVEDLNIKLIDLLEVDINA